MPETVIVYDGGVPHGRRDVVGPPSIDTSKVPVQTGLIYVKVKVKDPAGAVNVPVGEIVKGPQGEPTRVAEAVIV